MLVIKQKNGRVRLIAEGHDPRLKDGEVIMRQIEDTTASEFYEAGIKWGDVVAWATASLGIRQCGQCKARQAILNKIGELGVAETLRQIKETLGK